MAAFYAWLRRHPRLVDGVLAAVLSIGGIAPSIATHRAALLLMTLGLSVPVVFRRAYPLGAFSFAVAVGAAQVLFDLRLLAADLSILVLLYTLAAYTPRRTSVAGLGVCIAGSVTAVLRWGPMPAHISGPTWLLGESALFVAPALLAWVLGDSMRYRRAYYASLEERAARLERDRDAQAMIAAAAERARIARELHDIVAHNVSVMVVQADGATYALDSDPDQTRNALSAISATGRQALREMRVLLGVLRRTSDQGADDATRAPLPGLDQLDDLLEQTRAAGLPVSRTVQGGPRELPGGAALAAYRIVQESLTNTRKHAGPEAKAYVSLRYLEDVVEITVADDGQGASAVTDGRGHGLTGMAERAAIYGGSVLAGPRPGGGYQVTARLPLASPRAGAA